LRKLLLVIVLAVAALPLAAAQASQSRPRFAPAPYAGQCGLPLAQPIWMEFGWPTPQFNAIMGKRGVVVGASTGDYPAQLRAAGAATVYFDLNLNKRIGTTTAPVDPAVIPDKAKKFYDFAVQQIGCSTPVIVMNELAGASLVTPWSDENAQYRANALAFVQALSQLGAHPVLLVPVSPYSGGDAAAWWQQAAQYAEIVREVYVPATLVWADGATFGSRVLRQAYRQGIQDFTSMGIPANKLGLMVSFATTKGFGGRNGLRPATAWYQVAKWQALAAKQVAAETGIASIWSWGWGEWSAAEQDPAKPYALCAWLWTRSAKLCDAPKAIGRKRFDTSRREGQLSLLSPGTQCLVGGRALSQAAMARLQLVTGDREEAYSALFERLVESANAAVLQKDVLAAERAVVAQAFHGSSAAYHAALGRAHASVTVARGVLGDELRRARVERGLFAPAASGSEVSTFYSSYPDLLVRLVSAKPAPVWLGRKTQGFALSQVAPDVLFSLGTGRSAAIRTSEGKFTVKALASALPLGAVPLGRARPAIAAALRSFARGSAFERWTIARQRGALDDTLCQRDDLPQPAAVDLASYLPFLRLG